MAIGDFNLNIGKQDILNSITEGAYKALRDTLTQVNSLGPFKITKQEVLNAISRGAKEAVL